MPEHQEIEWKESWHDEYLKWICGYANSQGGTLIIGKDDNGNTVGVNKSKELLETLPNKITNALGIIADVNLRTEDEKEYIEIVVDKYPSLISYHGKFYYRSGSVLREIVGRELERALIKSQGRTWDGVSIPKLRVADLDQNAIIFFKKKAAEYNRLTEEETEVSGEILMDNLRLVDDQGLLNRAAVLAFHHDPERWVFGACIRIGLFGSSDSDLRYHNAIHGPLIEQVDRALDLIYTKYMKGLITYEGIYRREIFMFPREALREILLNAVVHKDYSSCNTIQISIYEDHLCIWNDGHMPEELRTASSLYEKHSSKPFNPKLAYVFYLSGMIEAWGRGFDKIKSACEDYYNTPLPKYDIQKDGIMVHCGANKPYLSLLLRNRLGINDSQLDRFKKSEQDDILQIMQLVAEAGSVSRSEIRQVINKPKTSVARLLTKMCDMGLLAQIGSGRHLRYVKPF